MTYTEARTHFSQYLKRIGRSPETITTYDRNIKQFANFLTEFYPRITSVADTTIALVSDYQDYLSGIEDGTGKSLSGKTIQLKLVALRTFFRFLVREDYMHADPTKHLVLPKQERRLSRSVLTEDEVKQVLDSCDLRTPKSTRDRAILELLYACGIRTSELCNLTVNDVDLRSQTVAILHGKGDKSRVVPIGQYATHYISEYLKAARGRFSRNSRTDSGYLFLTQFGNSFDRKSINKHVMHPIERKLELKKSLTCYSFRHSVATHLLSRGLDVSYIAQLLGHESLTTTQQYLKIEIGDLRRVHAQYHPRESDSNATP